MTELDSTDEVILEMLFEDARRSYRDIADEVGLSPPTVSNRVDRLRDIGVIERFTLDVDRSAIAAGDECLLVVETGLGHADAVFDALRDSEGVEHAFYTADSTVIAKAVLSPPDAHALVTDALSDDQVSEYHVEPVLGSSWDPQLVADDLDAECSICGQPITGEGETVEVDSDDLYHVCCSACAEQIVDQYESLKEGADEATQ